MEKKAAASDNLEDCPETLPIHRPLDLERRTYWDGQTLVKFSGFWFQEAFFRPILPALDNFKARDSDIVVATVPKSGTTWLKALVFSIAKRDVIPLDQSPLLTSNPHDVVPYFDVENANLDHIPCPRIYSTHIPYSVLPDTIREAKCRIIYLCRNPADQFVSLHHFLLENRFEKEAIPLGMEEAFDMFCQGIHPFGPFWEHIIEYWNEDLQNPRKVLFLKYEEMLEDTPGHVRKIAEFLGCPFGEKEEEEGVAEKISRLCSFSSLKMMEANKKGYTLGFLKNTTFFRKGEVGDWANHLDLAMADRMDKIIQTKFRGTGLNFDTFSAAN